MPLQSRVSPFGELFATPARGTLMGFLGVDVGPARLPNGNLSPEQRDKLRGDLDALGFFNWR